MKLFLAAILVAGLGFCSPKSEAQVNFGTATNQFTYTSVNGGTGGIVGVIIPNGGGTVVNVATGSAALPLQNIANTPGATHVSLYDDSSINVPLGFDFPYWGRNFNNSWMYSNGIVSFVNGNIPGAGCCGGLDLSTLRDSQYNYMIAPLWTDLYDTSGQSTWYKRTPNSMTYGWYGTSEFGAWNSSNSFEVDINSSGAFNVRYGNAQIVNHYVTSGFTGDLSKGQWFQYRYGPGMSITTTNPVSYGTTTALGTVDQCSIDPLSSPTCPNYATAYLNQQCTINALFDPTCPGYQVAYFNQQCSISPLYNSACPGYYQAYHDQQCSINPLYATDCPGYAAAYLSQQCSLNTLYSPSCPGYETAYRNYLFAQACQANPQSAPTCSGYVTPTVTTTTTTNTTTPTTTTTTAVAPTTTTTAVTTTLSTSEPPTTVSVSTSGTLTSPTQVATVSDPVVNNVISNNNTTTSTVSSPTSATTTPSSPSSPTAPTATATNAAVSPTPAPTPAPQPTRASMSAPKPTKEQAAIMGNNAMKESESAGSMEQQKQVQNVVIGAMGFVPGFDAYNVALKDVAFYKPYSIYGNQRTIDNRNASRGLFGATDAVHNEMVNSQYK